MSEVNVRVMGRELDLKHNGKQRMVNKLLYADESVLIVESEKSLQRIMNMSGTVSREEN